MLSWRRLVSVFVFMLALVVVASAQAHKRHPLRLPPHYRAWLCIHRYEAPGSRSWHINTGNGYYGGLQFAYSTWVRNGGRRFAAYAHQATPLQQMWVAESAWRESGGSFSQWPNTARMCGLL